MMNEQAAAGVIFGTGRSFFSEAGRGIRRRISALSRTGERDGPSYLTTYAAKMTTKVKPVVFIFRHPKMKNSNLKLYFGRRRA